MRKVVLLMAFAWYAFAAHAQAGQKNTSPTTSKVQPGQPAANGTTSHSGAKLQQQQLSPASQPSSKSTTSTQPLKSGNRPQAKTQPAKPVKTERKATITKTEPKAKPTAAKTQLAGPSNSKAKDGPGGN